MKPTIAFLTTETLPGGTATSTKVLVDNLDTCKFHVKGVSVSQSEIASSILGNAEKYDSLNLEPFPQIKQLSRGKIKRSFRHWIALAGWFMKAIWRFRKWLRENHIDIVHTNSLHANCVAGFATIGMKSCSIWHIRAPQRRAWLRGGPLLIEGYLASWLANKFIANSHCTLQSFHKSWRKKATVIFNAVDIEDIAYHQKNGILKRMIGIGETDKLVGLIGLISHRKGIDRFIHMAGELAKRAPHVHFVVIGGAHNAISRQICHQLISLVKMYQLENRVHLIGDVERAPLYASDMNAFFMCSRPGTETFGLVVIEAMAAGVPVVAFSNDAMPEIIQDGYSGFLVPEGDIYEAADIIYRLLFDHALAEYIRKNAWAMAKERFDKSRLMIRVQDLYCDILT